jgi:hypothetical protein
MGGCRLETTAPVGEGTVVRLELGLPEHGPPLIVEGTVIRAAGPRGKAVRFGPPRSARDRDRLRWVVQRLATGLESGC